MAKERQVTEPPAEGAASPDPPSMLTNKAFVVLLLLAAVVGVVVSLAASGRGGHVPAEGLKTEGTQPIELPGVMLAAANLVPRRRLDGGSSQ